MEQPSFIRKTKKTKVESQIELLKNQEQAIIDDLSKYLLKNKVEFALKFGPAREAFYQLVFRKIENQVEYLKSQLGTIQKQLLRQERIFARIEIRRQGRVLLECKSGYRLGCPGVYQCDNYDYLQEFSCVGCQQYLSEKDISKGNYRLYVSDYANEVDKEEFFAP
ncbi:13682_t:CDS:2 [Entrophospora sp. SA101]|nr:6284_t:CDS:2 [Entrophospora sp. SA101]CAJ0842943.1 13682_t:CDS:2 [Entrophospora sp. SA101]